MLSCSIWFSEPSFWMGGDLDSSCVGRVYGAKNTSIKLLFCIKFAFHIISSSYVYINTKRCSSLSGYLVKTGAKNHGVCSLHLQQRIEQCCVLFTIRIYLLFTLRVSSFQRLKN
jgi:hypothetical protein